jgi:hypothetical protein
MGNSQIVIADEFWGIVDGEIIYFWGDKEIRYELSWNFVKIVWFEWNLINGSYKIG